MISNGQDADQQAFNLAFLSRTQDTSTVGKFSLLKAAGSGATIADVQLLLNTLSSGLTNATDALALLTAIAPTVGSSPIINGQLTEADLEDLSFDGAAHSVVFLDYLIRRVTTGAGATARFEGGSIMLVYNSATSTWHLVPTSLVGPDVSGVTLSITTAAGVGQVTHTSDSISGDASVSDIKFSYRTLGV